MPPIPGESREEWITREASKRPQTERSAFLESACAGNASLLQRVVALLRAREAEAAEEGTVVDVNALRQRVQAGLKAEPEPAKDDPRAPASGPELTGEERPGSIIGRYRLLEKIGEGGFGAVYVAEQKEPVKRRVALKIIKLGMDTRQVVARFEAERQALALMDHPNIAKIYDGGATESGRPFFVMELVQGIPITRYCDENNLTTEQRLELFTQTCQAIQHAHQKGIIHRDIKPSNILVTVHAADSRPVPKVIDFGIAKATQAGLTDKTVYTNFQQFIGTPAYVSPEQAEMSGLDIDTRSDIYSLGVLLYELMVGKTPFDTKELLQVGLDAMRKVIREQEPVRPSTRLNGMPEEEQTTTAKRRGAQAPELISLLRGDLDWIVMKCLEKDRTLRYETANGLAMDVQRFLSSEPVVARPPSRVYRFRKMVRRNKVEFTVAGVVTAALVIGLGLSTWLFIQGHRAQLSQFRQQEGQILNRIIAGVTFTEAEKELARNCTRRLTDRVKLGLGSEIDHDLLAHFLARGVHLKGRLIQVTDHPTFSVSAWESSGYPVDGVAAILRPLVALDGTEISFGGDDIYITGGNPSRGSEQGRTILIDTKAVSVLPGVRKLSCIVDAQLVHDPPEPIAVRMLGHTGNPPSNILAEEALYLHTRKFKAESQPIGKPVRIVLPSLDRLFLRQLPSEYPTEIIDEAARGQLTNGLSLRCVHSSIQTAKGYACELEFLLHRPSPTLPIALRVDLIDIGGITVNYWLGSLFVNEDGSAYYERGNTALELDGGVYTDNKKIKWKLSFVITEIKSLPVSGKPKPASLRIRFRSSRDAALAAQDMECFLSVPEFIRVLPLAGTESPAK